MKDFVNVDWVGDTIKKRSTNDYIFKIWNSPMSLCGNKQSKVVISLVEAKYCALMENTKYVIQLRGLLREIKHEKPRLPINFDNNIKKSNHLKI